MVERHHCLLPDGALERQQHDAPDEYPLRPGCKDPMDQFWLEVDEAKYYSRAYYYSRVCRACPWDL